jgi:hypothetical protein
MKRFSLFMVLAVTIAVGAIVFVSTGCAGGSDDETRFAETSISDKDQAHAEDILLRLSDLPTGWEVSQDDQEQGSTASEVCTNLDFSDVVVTGKADQAGFEYGGMTYVGSSAKVFAGPAADIFEQYASNETATCLRDYLKQQYAEDPPPELEIGDVTVGLLSFPSIAENSRAYQLVIEFKAEGESANVYLDCVFLQKGRAMAFVMFGDTLTPFDDDLRVELAKTVAARM